MTPKHILPFSSRECEELEVKKANSPKLEFNIRTLLYVRSHRADLVIHILTRATLPLFLVYFFLMIITHIVSTLTIIISNYYIGKSEQVKVDIILAYSPMKYQEIISTFITLQMLSHYQEI